MLGVGYLHERRPQKDTFPPHAPLSVTGLLLERRSFTGVFVTSLDLRRAKPLKQTQPGRPQPRSVWPVTQGQFMRLTEIPGTRHRQEACTERQAGLGQRSHAGRPGHLSLFSGLSELLGHGQTPRPSPCSPGSHGEWELAPQRPCTPLQCSPPSVPPDRGSSGVRGEFHVCTTPPCKVSLLEELSAFGGGTRSESSGKGPQGTGSPQTLCPGFAQSTLASQGCSWHPEMQPKAPTQTDTRGPRHLGM